MLKPQCDSHSLIPHLFLGINCLRREDCHLLGTYALDPPRDPTVVVLQKHLDGNRVLVCVDHSNAIVAG